MNNNSSWFLVKRLFRELVKPYYNKIIIAIISMIIAAAGTAGQAYLMKPILDDVFLNKNHQFLFIIPIFIIGIFFIKAVAEFVESVMLKFVSQRILIDIQMRLYKHVLHSDISFIQNKSSGQLISRFTNDINTMRRSLAIFITGIAKETFTLIFLVSLMFYQSWLLSIIAFVVFPLAAYPIIKLGRKMKKVTARIQNSHGDFTEQLDETFRGIKIVKAYNAEDFEYNRANNISENIFQLYVKAAKTESLSSPIMELLSGVGIAIVIWYGGIQVLNTSTSPGAFFSFISAFILAYRPMKGLASMNTTMQEGFAALKRIFDLLDEKADIIECTEPLSLEGEQTDIKFNNVIFNYNEKSPALNGVTLEIPSGKMVALVGASGSGKSTLMQLLLRFYEPAHGNITINNNDLKSYSLHSLHQSMALVTQETLLFDDTIMANIAYGHEVIDEAKVIEAAKMANADEFISQLNDGYNTKVGQHGFKLSGGQRQRLAIARALYKDAPILLLDEATSSLDNVSEKLIQDALDKLMKDRTSLVVAHRLSTVINADIIYVMNEGRVVESGTHHDLLAKNGIYAKLYAKNLDE